MRDGWTEATPNIRKLEDLAFLKRGHDLPTQSRVEGHYPVVASNGSVGFHHECIGPVPGVVTGRSGTIGKVMYLESGYWPLNTTLYVTDFKGNNEKFVALTLETMHLENFAGGTTVPSLDRKVFRGELVYVPSVLEQKRIVDVVSSVDVYIDALQQQVDLAHTARNAVLHELLSAGGDGWTETTLGDVAEYINGYPFKPSDLGDEGTAVIRIKQLLDPMEKVDRTNVDVPERCVLRDGDVIFSWSGTLAVRVWNRGHAYLNQHLFRVIKKTGVSHEWLPLVIEHAIEDLVEKSHGTTMKHITKQTLLPHQVSLPPLVEQKRIVDILSSMDELIQSTEKAVVDAKNLRSGLLSSLLSGEHEIPASYDSLLGAA